MDSFVPILKLLTEIRDLQHQHLAEYKKFTARALETQELAVKRQASHLALYKRVVLVGGIIILAIVVFLILFVNHRLP